MTPTISDAGDPRGFDDSATRAVGLAEREARELDHDRIGTEHLLLGLLTNHSHASAVLTDVGVTLAATRTKVSEAVGPAPARRADVTGSLPQTPRAGRALGRARRFAHGDGAHLVNSDHLLWGVLDVEGTAGQVLRGLGIDVDALHASLETMSTAHASMAEAESELGVESDAETIAEPAPRHLRAPRCPSCDEALEGQLVWTFVTAASDSGVLRDVPLVSCGSCGRVLGVGQP